ncbi:MAG: biliverdin-producing heme oxygenase [Sandaracinaceae bacterium]
MSLLDALRAATARPHERLHQHQFMQELEGAGLNRPRYRTLLRAFLHPWQRLERHLEDAAHAGPWRALIQVRATDIEADLAALGSPTRAGQNPRVHMHDDAALGAAYALVGSSMGAPSLRAAVVRAEPDASTRFLGLSPREAGWPALARYLRSTTTEDPATVCDGARDVFQSIHAALDSHPSTRAREPRSARHHRARS